MFDELPFFHEPFVVPPATPALEQHPDVKRHRLAEVLFLVCPSVIG